ncbi:hypothetical protein SVAN01_08336 [Stagonosporopsis vannaccii]|nr:hypothetical protein SVAN01_08336 [Stagonosporopsis vannaccii]
MTLAILFLDRNSGNYPSRADLGMRITVWLGNKCDREVAWFKAERDIELLVNAVMTCGGVTVDELPACKGEGEVRRQGMGEEGGVVGWYEVERRNMGLSEDSGQLCTLSNTK